MENQNEAVETNEAVEATVVRPKTEQYVKAVSASGKKTMHTGDTVACTLASLVLEETREVASVMLNLSIDELTERYSKLNIGMQRMNLGNLIRGAIAKANKGNQIEINKAMRSNDQIDKRNVKAVEKARKAHHVLIEKAIKDGGQMAAFDESTVDLEVRFDIPEFVEGNGDTQFGELVAKYAVSIEERRIEAEAIAKVKADAKAEREEAAKAKAVAKAEKAEIVKAAKEAKAAKEEEVA